MNIVYSRIFTGFSYVLLFFSAYLLLIYFEEHSVHRFVLLGFFTFSTIVVSVKLFLLKLKMKIWFVFSIVILASTNEILNNMYHGSPVFYTSILSFFAATIVGYTLNNLYISNKVLFIMTFSILFGLIFFILQYEIILSPYASPYLSERNMISMISIPMLVVLFVQYQKNRFEFPYVLMFAAALSLILSIMAVGRSGIITSIIMFAASLIATVSGDKSKSYIGKLGKRIISILLVIILMSVMFITFFDYISAKLSYLLFSGLTDAARINLALQYFESLTFSNFFYGTNYRQTSDLGGNLHNTFLTYHGNYGAFAIIIFLIYFYSIAKTAWNKEVFMTLVFLSFSLRILTDTGNDFFTHLGIFVVIFYGLKTKRIIQKNFNQS